MMTYAAAIARLLSLVDHERTMPAVPRQKRIYDLAGIARLLARMGDPHRRQGRIIHIAGTKGKGSVAAMVEAILRAAGAATGFYSSPHLHSFCERIRRDGAPVSPERFAGLVDAVWPHHLDNAADPDAGPATLFEYLTAMAFQCFAADEVDASVIEVGLGGRLDATNVVTPAVSVITPVSLDHTAILGDTIGEIAADKAGIIKPGVPVVTAPQFPEALAAIETAATAQSAPLARVDETVRWQAAPVPYAGQDLTIRTAQHTYRAVLPLLGDFQAGNAAVAVAAVEALASAGGCAALSPAAVTAGLESVEWPGRLETLRREPPAVVADGAHNDHSIATALATLSTYTPHRRLVVVAGFSRDKRVGDMAALLAGRAHRVIATRSRHPRSMRPPDIVATFCGQGFPRGRLSAADSVGAALDAALAAADAGDLILATGSLFVAAEAREAMLGIPAETYPDLLPPDLRQPDAPHNAI